MAQGEEDTAHVPPEADSRTWQASPTRKPYDPEFEVFFKDKQPELVKVGWAMCRNQHDAEDAAMAVMTQIYLRWPTIDNPWAYARTALIREINKVRTSARSRLTDLRPSDEVPTVAVGFAEFDAYETQEWVEQQLACLPPAQREVLRLFVLEDLSVKEIAARLHKSPPTVRKHSSLGRQKMQPAAQHYAPQPRASHSETAEKESR